jgi:hypothetical protein
MTEKVGNFAIMELGVMLDDFAEKHGVSNISVSMSLPSEDFRKLDEDIYYRNIGDGRDYEPSVGKMNVKFRHSVITIEEA